MGYNTNDPNKGIQFPPIDQPTVMPPKQKNKRGRGRGNGNTPSNLPPNPISEFFVVDDRFAPPKTLAPRPWGTWLLTLVGVLAVIGVMFVLISALTNDVAGVQESVDSSAQAVVGAVRDELANLPVQPMPDMSGIESQLSELRAQNTTLILRSQKLEAQLNVALTGIATTPESVAFFASNTPPAPAEVNATDATQVVTDETPTAEVTSETATADATTSQTTATDTLILDVNQVMMKANAPIYFVPNIRDDSQAIIQEEITLMIEGVFTDRDGQKWAVFKPQLELGLSLSTSDETALYNREQVFVPFDLRFIASGDVNPLPSLRLTISDPVGRVYRSTPERPQNNQPSNILYSGVNSRGITSVRAIDFIRNGDEIIWVRVDITDLTVSIRGERTYAFIIFDNDGTPAFSETDLAILERMPNTPADFIPVSATTQAPAAQPTNPPAQPPSLNPLATPTP